ncbi:MAG: hypothetical protein CMA79_05435 [Euryarchaeota archaeon]|jgi:hypothetical protein|nr:hypothetical protein [Euryarchaeota archaeon]|tara:strand:- start:2330 stop:2554 length:225 start_codon:yes stop_codon:yes gene_type:complete
MEIFLCEDIMQEEIDGLELVVAAIATVLIEESMKVSLKLSPGRERGKSWSIDHRQILVGREGLVRTRAKRGPNR